MSGISKRKTYFNLSTTTLSQIPKNPKDDLSDPNWKYAVNDEFDGLIKNKT